MKKSESLKLAGQIYDTVKSEGIVSVYVGKNYTDVFNRVRMYLGHADISVNSDYVMTVSTATIDKARKLVADVTRYGIESLYVGNDYENLLNRLHQVSIDKMLDLDITVENGVMTIKRKDKV